VRSLAFARRKGGDDSLREELLLGLSAALGTLLDVTHFPYRFGDQEHERAQDSADLVPESKKGEGALSVSMFRRSIAHRRTGAHWQEKVKGKGGGKRTPGM
jgi:hypothetical protein